jgi:hypothetical protein
MRHSEYWARSVETDSFVRTQWEVDMSLVITSLYAAILALFYVVLAALVIRQRFKHRVGLGTGKEPQLLQTVRMHGNFAEYVPFLLILVALLELQQSPVWQLHLVAGLTLAGRVLHACGLWRSSGTSMPRFLGMISTFTALIVGAVLLLVK